MRIFHCSDWHLGRQTHGVSRRPDHEAVLEEMVAIARDSKPHLVLHSGDLFETSRPAIDDMRLAQEALTRLAEVAPVVCIAGNHDSPALFELFAALLGSKSRVAYVGAVRQPTRGGILEVPGEAGEIARVGLLPFVHANRVVDALEHAPEARTMAYADRLQKIQQAFGEALARDYHPDRHILLFCAHLFVAGATWSRSERPLHVSDTYATRVTNIPDVSYAAFGHIHKPQALPGGVPGRYAGSPIALDFGEEGETKEVVLVEARPGRGARIEPVPLSGGRALVSLRGTCQTLEAHDVGEALLRLTVETAEPTPGLAEWASRVFSQATILEVNERCSASAVPLADEVTADMEEFEDLSQAFDAYLAEGVPSDQSTETLRTVFTQVRLDGSQVPDPLLRLEQLVS